MERAGSVGGEELEVGRAGVEGLLGDGVQGAMASTTWSFVWRELDRAERGKVDWVRSETKNGERQLVFIQNKRRGPEMKWNPDM